MTEKVLRYLLLATHVPPSGSSGGVVRYTVALAEALARRSDVELHVLVAGAGGAAFADMLPPDRVHGLRAAPTAAHSLREWFSLAPVLRTGRFDVVHGCKHMLPRVARGATRVLTVHDMLLLDRPGDFSRQKRMLLRLPYRSSIACADVVVPVSAAACARLLDYVPSVAGRATPVPLAPSAALLAAPPEPVAALAGRRFALVVGDASARKNLRMVIRTWPAVRERVGDAVLVVVGPLPWGAEDTGNEDGKRLLADGSLVHLRGVPDGTLRWCYENAAVLLCPSLIEGFGLPAVEAQAFGTPVVTSDDPALCEAAAGWSLPTAAWAPENWLDAVSASVEQHRASPAPTALRTWDDVAEETVAAIRARRAGTAGAVVGPAALEHRIGVSPYSAPLRVQHVVAPGDEQAASTAERLVDAHRRHGWTADVARSDEVDHSVATTHDVVVVHGRAAATVRRSLRGAVTTVVLAGTERLGPRARLAERRLSPWTHALVLPHAPAPGWDGLPVPITRTTTEPLDPDEAAAIFVRARAWGRPTPRDELAQLSVR